MSVRRRSAPGQALVEAALVLPVLLLLGLGVVVLARLADAVAGVDAATAAAASAASRSASAAEAQATGAAAFSAALGGYGLGSPAVAIDAGAFTRAGRVTVTGQATVDLAFAPVPGLPRSLVVRSAVSAPVERWRSR